ncbi:hypothetical protein F2P56_021618 [Juglans regia]|uniref:Uncharacterized protein n=2 Tax=Juglans regia TaxID=51240 RepID=A0A833TXK8_JUGRE|nr:transcription factor MYB113-like [Juglans regia]KAF5457521.1 hypothetical protein F2P56_021618 [Juglans regia]
MVANLGLRKGAWTAEEDIRLRKCIGEHGQGNWHQVPLRAGLNRCRKSCRQRWLNYLRPNIKRGNFSTDEVDLMIRLHKLLGNRWSLIAGRLPGRTSNDVKNYWNTHMHKYVEEKPVLDVKKVSVIKPQPRRVLSKNLTVLNGKPTVKEISFRTEDDVRNYISPTVMSYEKKFKTSTVQLDNFKGNERSTCPISELDEEPNLWWKNLLDYCEGDVHRVTSTISGRDEEQNLWGGNLLNDCEGDVQRAAYTKSGFDDQEPNTWADETSLLPEAHDSVGATFDEDGSSCTGADHFPFENGLWDFLN